MTDDKTPKTSGPATPNRDRPREASIIDARPGDVRESKPPGPIISPPPGAAARATSSQTTPPASAATAANPTETGSAKPGGAPAGATTASSAKPAETAAAKTESSKTEPSRNETPKTEPSKPENAKPENAKPDPAKPAVATASSLPSTAAATPAASATGTPGKTAEPAKTADAAKPASPNASNKGAENNPAEKKAGAGIGAMLAASIAGGAIALGGAYGWQQTRGGDSAVAGLASRVKANEDALAALKKSASPLDGMERRISALEAATKQQAAAVDTMKSDLARIGNAAPATPAAGAPSASAPDISSLETRIAALEKMAAAPKSSQRAATADPDAKRAAAPGGAPSKSAAEPSEPAKPVAEAPAEKPAAPPATPAATPQVPAAIAALPPEVAKLEARLKELEGKIKPPADLEPLNTRIAALAGQIEPLAKKIEPLEKQVDGKIAPIAESLAKSAANITANAKAIETAGQQAAVSMARSNAAASAIVARTLADRVAAGKPFGGLIAALEAMGTKGESVDMLKPLAEKGVPAKAALVSQFQSLESRLLEPEAPPASAPLTERLKQGALSLVKVRPVGKPEGTSPGALYARILGALRQDRFEEAKKLYDVLPPKSRQLAEQWAQNLQTRIAAESAAQSVLSDALTQLQQRK